MKKRVISILISLALILPTLTFGVSITVSSQEGVYFVPTLRFIATSDIHIGTATGKGAVRVEEMLEQMYAYVDNENLNDGYDKLDAVIVAGDITQDGTEAQLNVAKTVLDESIKDGTELVITMGNHDWNTMLSESQTAFESLFGQTTKDTIIGGYHFITIVGDKDNGWDYSEETKAEAEALIQVAIADTGENKPVFVIQHIGNLNTVVGTNEVPASRSPTAVDTLHDMQSQYPNLVVFAGHSHFAANDPCSIHQESYTSINTGSLVSSLALRVNNEYIEMPNSTDVTHFQLVEIDATGRMRVRQWDTEKQDFIGETWMVESYSKEGFIYTVDRFSANDIFFADGAEVTVEEVKSDSVLISFLPTPKESLPGRVYKISVADPTGTEVFAKYIGTDWFNEKYDTPIKSWVDGLLPSVKYDISVSAVNSLYTTEIMEDTTLSSEPISVSVTTAEETETIPTVIYEEWDFQDLKAGDVLTKGYINATANGNFKATTSTQSGGFLVIDGWEAVADAENEGNIYIQALNRNFTIEDESLMLMNNTYEVSWRMKVLSVKATNLLWWSNDGAAVDRYPLLRIGTNGELGYVTTSETKTGVNATVGESAEWHNYRVRVSPEDGHIQFWFDGELIADFINVGLAENSASSEYSTLGIFHNWTSGFEICLDDIKLTGVMLDEHIKFDLPQIAEAPNAIWNFDDGKFATQNGMTVSGGWRPSYTTYPDSMNGCLYIDPQYSSVTSPQVTLPKTINDYKSISVSWKMNYMSDPGNWTNVFQIFKSDGSTQVLFRIGHQKGAADTSTKARLLGNYGTAAGTLAYGEWVDFNVTITPKTQDISIKVGDIKVALTDAEKTTLSTIIKGLCDNDNSFAFTLYNHASMSPSIYIDDLSVATELVLPSVKSIVDGELKDPALSMIEPTVSGLTNEDWEITAAPNIESPDATWNFEDSKLATQNNITVSGGDSRYSFVAEDTNTVLSFKSDKSTVTLPTITLPKNINSYETISISWKMKYTLAGNWTNVFRVIDSNGTATPIMKVGHNKSDTSGTIVARMFNQWGTIIGTLSNGEWMRFDVTIVPQSGDVSIKVDGTEATIKATEKNELYNIVKSLYDNEKAFAFNLYYHTSMYPDGSIDDLCIETVLASNDPDNTVLKTLIDTDGNTRGIFTLQDKELYLAKQPFEFSFDYRLNQLPSSWLNLVRMNTNGKNVAILRLSNTGRITNYTESAQNIELNVSGDKTVAVGIWNNFRLVINPVSGHIVCYLNNELVCDYNINDVYTDTTGMPLGVFENPTKMILEISSQYSKSVLINDSCIDNVHIRTLPVREYTRVDIAKADFNGLSVGELTKDEFSSSSGGLYATDISGNITVEGGTLGKHVLATITGGQGIKIDMTHGYAPFAADVVSLGGNFTFTSFGESGKLKLFSLSRDGECCDILSISSNGSAFLGAVDCDFRFELDTTYNIKTLVSGLSGLASLYVNDELIYSGAPLGLSISSLKCNDGSGEAFFYSSDRIMEYDFVDDNGELIRSVSGKVLKTSEYADFTKINWCEDELTIFGVDGQDSWTVVLDDLSVRREEKAYIYHSGASENVKLFDDTNGVLWGKNFIISGKIDSSKMSNNTPIASINFGDETIILAYISSDGNIYKPDGITIIASYNLDSVNDIAFAVSMKPWEYYVKSDDFVICVSLYVDETFVCKYTVGNISAKTNGKITFGSADSDLLFEDCKVYYGLYLRQYAEEGSAVAEFNGYNALTINFEDESFFDLVDSDGVEYLDWNISRLGTTITDSDGATVTLSEYRQDESGNYLRLRRPESNVKPDAYMEYNLAALGSCGEHYSIEMEIRYVDDVASSLDIATLYEKNLTGKLTLLSVHGDRSLYFENNGMRYYLCNSSGTPLYVNSPSAESFTSIGFVVDEASGHYSIWINEKNAYYYANGEKSGEAVPAYKIPLRYVKQTSYTICDPVVRLFVASSNIASDSVADLDNLSIDVIRNGIAPSNVGYQTDELGKAVRFIATVDSLYANTVGFEVIAKSNIDGEKTYVDTSNVVFSSIIAQKEPIYAEDIGGRYITAISITNLKVAQYTFVIRPFAEVFGERVYGEETVYEYNLG